MPGERGDGQASGCGGDADLVGQQEPPPVGAVGDRPSEEGHGDQGEQLHRPQESDQEGRPGLDVQLVGQGDQRGLRPQVGDEVPADDQAQLAAVAQRGEIGGEAGKGQARQANRWPPPSPRRSVVAPARPRVSARAQLVVVRDALPLVVPLPEPAAGAAGRSSDAHAREAAWNFLLVAILAGNTGPLPEKLGAGSL